MCDNGMLPERFAVQDRVRPWKPCLFLLCFDASTSGLPSDRCGLSNTPHVSNLSHLRIPGIEQTVRCAAE
jgi:hypothetical protein